MKQALKERAHDAENLIKFYEEQGRKVVGVSFNGKEIHLDFQAEETQAFTSADLARMD
jgi:hypothetical protein